MRRWAIEFPTSSRLGDDDVVARLVYRQPLRSEPDMVDVLVSIRATPTALTAVEGCPLDEAVAEAMGTCAAAFDHDYRGMPPGAPLLKLAVVCEQLNERGVVLDLTHTQVDHAREYFGSTTQPLSHIEELEARHEKAGA